MANQSWINKYDLVEAVFLNEGIFDHTPGILTLYPNVNSKANWIQQGDCNTALFHACIKQRQRQNRILSIERYDGSRVHEPELIMVAFLDYYKGLLGSKMEQRRKVDARIIARGLVLTKEQIIGLTQRFTSEEVKKAAFSIPGNKSPRPDGFSSNFFQDDWELIGEDISGAVIAFLESGNILKEINSTIITLVPKCKCPNSVKDFRPIACCYVIHKIATKLLSSRISNILPEIISHSQGGFTKGRFIGHNIMICQDLVRHYCRKANKPSCMIKLDLQKAYDTVEWEFLEEVLIGLNFPSTFIQLIMNCVSTPKFSLMFNGTLHCFFASRKGLRQGDPMSPLLFVLGMEYFSRLMGKIGEKEDFHFHDRCIYISFLTTGMSGQAFQAFISYSRPVHVFLPKNDLKQAFVILTRVLLEYECVIHVTSLKALLINISKIVWIGFCNFQASRDMSSLSHIWEFQFVLIRYPGKKAYWSQIIIMPKRIMNSIEAICRAFLWKGQAMFSGAGAVAWDNVCQPKSIGGLGITKLETWNKAAMSKYIWAISNNQESLWLREINMLSTQDTNCSAPQNRKLIGEKRKTNQCLVEIKSWLGWKAITFNVQQLVKWIGRAKISKFRKAIYSVAVAAMVYTAWKLRNAVLWQGAQVDTNRMIEEVKWSLRTWVQNFLPKKLSSVDKEWFFAL
ncbi:uncharacterized protein LOC133039284 [Cannabis sativa]|uniref:uncharacterized protein LOC133039284 n=1 Tax=Cannabis sativa TaxID=3483 RepID=UPI0029C9FFBE|nr:uncharacterized protein LOC133039284 [Cannabis sativa]